MSPTTQMSTHIGASGSSQLVHRSAVQRQQQQSHDFLHHQIDASVSAVGTTIIDSPLTPHPHQQLVYSPTGQHHSLQQQQQQLSSLQPQDHRLHQQQVHHQQLAPSSSSSSSGSAGNGAGVPFYPWMGIVGRSSQFVCISRPYETDGH